MYIKLVVSFFIRRKVRMIVVLFVVVIGVIIMLGFVIIYYDIFR